MTPDPPARGAVGPDALLHWLCCGFIVLYVLAMHYLYATVDRLSFVDHDIIILFPTIQGYPLSPSGHTWTAVKTFFAGNAIMSAQPAWPLANMQASLAFLLLGCTPFALKMSQALPLLAAALGVYALAHAASRKAWAGLAAAAFFLRLPVVFTEARTFFPFLAVAAALLWAGRALCANLDLRDGRKCVLFMACLWLATLIHLSAFLFIPIFFLLVIFWQRDTRRYLAMLAATAALYAWNGRQLSRWLGSKFQDHFAVASFSDGWTRFAASDLLALRLRPLWDELDRQFGEPFLFWLLLAGATLIARTALSRWRRPGPAFRTPREFIFLCGWTAGLTAFFAVNGMDSRPLPTSNLLVLHPLIAVIGASLLALVSEPQGKRRFWAPTLVILCLLHIFSDRAANMLRTVSDSRLPDLNSNYRSDRRMFLDDAVGDPGPLLSYLDRENRRLRGGDLRATALSVALSEHSAALRTDFSDPTHFILTPAAFFRGVRVLWEEELPQPDPGRAAPRPAPYLLVTVTDERHDSGGQAPRSELVLSQVKKLPRQNQQGFPARARLMASCRLHQNVFLYVYRRA